MVKLAPRKVVRPGRRTSVCIAALVAGSLLAAPARAFERQWHAGAGAGVALPDRLYSPGAALAVYAAYGLSDMFDARLDLRGSRHDAREERRRAVELFQGTLGLAYKVDVIEWIPFFGVRAGYYRFGSDPPPPLCAGGGVLGGMAGIDYAFSKHAAIGAELGYDMLLPVGATTSALVRAEYRWGW